MSFAWFKWHFFLCCNVAKSLLSAEYDCIITVVYVAILYTSINNFRKTWIFKGENKLELFGKKNTNSIENKPNDTRISKSVKLRKKA